MAFDVTILHGATIEVTEILEWYETQNDRLVFDFHEEYLASVEKLKVNPEAYGYIHGEYRRLLMEKFPYKIIYKISGNKVILYRISHTSRDDSKWFKNKE